MKGALRLAQSLCRQATEQIGLFHGFSRRAGADSSARQKRDSEGDFSPLKAPVGNADGCQARIGDTAKDISASDQVHLTEKGSVFLVQSIIGKLLHGQSPRASRGSP
jgi:hypothetical protein